MIKTKGTIVGLLSISLTACSLSSDNGTQDCLIVTQSNPFITLPAGQFTKSENPIYREEGQPHQVTVASYQLQAYEVTNEQFADFVEATQYITEAQKGSLEKRPGAGSAVFTRGLNGDEGRWELVDGLNWKSSHKPGQNQIKPNYPVVHVSYNDARAYAEWAGGRLPTEIEWEYAASLGIEDINNTFSGAYDSNGKPIANTWQGIFPIIDSGKDGHQGAAPVGCYPPNSIGLYDMIGNVWEWTSTPYGNQRQTIKGGSHLCANNFCKRYRPQARQPMESDFSSNHIGFRIAKDISTVK